jgi:hypothetical protein
MILQSRNTSFLRRLHLYSLDPAFLPAAALLFAVPAIILWRFYHRPPFNWAVANNPPFG